MEFDPNNIKNLELDISDSEDNFAGISLRTRRDMNGQNQPFSDSSNGIPDGQLPKALGFTQTVDQSVNQNSYEEGQIETGSLHQPISNNVKKNFDKSTFKRKRVVKASAKKK